MRKIVLFACLASLLGMADVVCTAVYVYKNPDSFLGRTANMAFTLGTRYNPFLYGYSAVSSTAANLLSKGSGSSVAQTETDCSQSCEEPKAEESEPIPVQWGEFQGAIELPMPHGPAADLNGDDAAWFGGNVVTTVEPPLASECDPAVLQVSGVMGGMVGPCCKPATGDCVNDHCFTGMFWKMIEECVAAAQAKDEAHWFGFWFSYFSAPSTLDYKGGSETAEPMDMTPDYYQEDPNASYHHDNCPSSVCPYSGKSYSDPVETPMEEEPMKAPKKKMKLPKIDDSEESDATPAIIPGIDTMEFRRSDRTWDDYGGPFGL
jgi:hypothetical protein